MEKNVISYINFVKDTVKNSKGNIESINFDVIFQKLKETENLDEFMDEFSTEKRENSIEISKEYAVKDGNFERRIIFIETKGVFEEEVKKVEYTKYDEDDEFSIYLKEEKDNIQRILEIRRFRI